MGKLISLSKKYYTEKIKTLLKLYKERVPIPDTILLSSDDVNQKNKLMQYALEWKSERFYLRFCFSDIDYPHYYSATPMLSELGCSFNKLHAQMQNKSHFDIICQPLLDKIEWSGGIIAYNHKLYIEFVYGMGALLFRNGRIYGRILIDEEKEKNKFYRQDTALHLIDGEVKETKINIDNFVIPQFSEIVHNITFCNDILYEFGISNNKNIYFFDGKKTHSFIFFEKINNIYSENVVLEEEHLTSKCFKTEYPMLKDLKNIHENMIVYIEKGAILSHLCSYMVQKGYKWIFSNI
ncbi:MAG: hypothetical protein HFG34_01545 [Eubacterium sp.]|nr:hypothetical protein [Eubacterium sp.]